MGGGWALSQAVASQSGGREEDRESSRSTKPRQRDPPRAPAPKAGLELQTGPGNQPRACACAKGSPAPAHLQVRSRFRPAFPGRKPQSPRMRFPALLLGHRSPQLQVIPPLPLSARPIARRWAGISRRGPAQGLCETGVDWLAPQAQVRASYWVWAEREPPSLPRRLQVSARTRRGSRPPRVRARGLAGEAAESEAAAPVASAPPPPPPPPPSRQPPRPGGRVASPPAASPVRPSVSPCEESAERISVRTPEPLPPLCRCL